MSDAQAVFLAAVVFVVVGVIGATGARFVVDRLWPERPAPRK